MGAMEQIESKTKVYADKRAALSALVGDLHTEIETAKRKYITAIKQAVAEAADAYSELHAAIDESRELFDRPRTKTLYGVKVGIQKQRGEVVIDDEERTIELIRKQLPDTQVELLIRTRRYVHKPSCYDLTAADLKRLAIKIENDSDKVIIKPTDGEVDKLVNALLKDAEKIEEADAA